MTEYHPDPSSKWVVFVRRGRSLMTSSSAATVDGLWEALAGSDPVSAVLGLITSGGIQDAPPFALVVPAGRSEVQTVVRGGFRVRASGEPVTGARVSTWSEHLLETSGGAYEITAPFARRSGTALPLVEGAAFAALVRVGDPAAIVDEVDASVDAVAAEIEVEVEPKGDAAARASESPTDDQESVVAPAPAAASDSTAGATIAPEHTLMPVDDNGADDAGADGAGAAVDDDVEDRTVVVVRTAKSPDRERVGAATPPVPQAPTTEASDAGDDDGTIALPAILRLREQRQAGSTAPDAPVAPAAPAAPVATTAPAVHLVLPGSVREPLTGEVVLGRSPGVTRAAGGRLPRLLTIGAGDPDISRSHVKVGLQGGTIVVTDLDSRNGTVVIQPGRPPVRLRSGEDTPVLVGTLIDLGGGWTVKVEGD